VQPLSIPPASVASRNYSSRAGLVALCGVSVLLPAYFDGRVRTPTSTTLSTDGKLALRGSTGSAGSADAQLLRQIRSARATAARIRGQALLCAPWYAIGQPCWRLPACRRRYRLGRGIFFVLEQRDIFGAYRDLLFFCC